MHSICFEHFVDVSNHLTCLSALDLVVWGMLDGATRGRCLIVLWGRRALSLDWFWVHGSYGGRGLHAWLRPGRHLDLYIVFWTALHVVSVSLFCEAGERCVSGLAFGTRQLWWPWVACLAAAWEAFECVHYIIIDFVSSMYGHWYWRAVVLGPSFWISRAGESGGVVYVAWSLGSWEAGVASECRLCWCLHTGTWCMWGIDQLSCVYFSLYWDLSSRCIGPGMTS